MSTFLLGGGRGFCFIVLVIVAAALLVAMIITAMTMAMAVTVIVPHLSSGVYVTCLGCVEEGMLTLAVSLESYGR